jgi:transketolase
MIKHTNTIAELVDRLGEAEASELSDVCTRLRLRVLEMISRANSSHVGTAFSMIELLAVLYWRALQVRPSQPNWPDRDRFVLSKGHGCAALYAALADRGFFPEEWLDSYYQNGARLAGHATHSGVPGIELSTGSLGHGLSVAAGMALAAQRDRRSWRSFVLLSDGECDEGSTWEAVLFASQHHLDNLIAIVDYNKIQSLGTVAEVITLEPFADKWRACGWAVREIDGHDLHAVSDALFAVPIEPGCPSCVIAHTVKGKGVSFMENKLLWHYRSPQGDEYAAARAELKNQS